MIVEIIASTNNDLEENQSNQMQPGENRPIGAERGER
jgi:hypothetical protein